MADETYLSEAPVDYTSQFKSKPVDFYTKNKAIGISQYFRGVVGKNSEIFLRSGAIPFTTYTLSEFPHSTSTSTLTIYSASVRPPGTDIDLSHAQDERIAKKKPNMGAAKRAIGRAMKSNRIRSIIQAPIDQILQMQVALLHKSDNVRGSPFPGSVAQIL